MVLCGVLLLGALAATARTVLDLDTSRQPVPLADWGDFWYDPDGTAGTQRVESDGRIAWQPTRRDAVYPLAAGQALWLRFTVPATPDAERWYFEVAQPSVDRVSLYSRDSTGAWTAQHAGDTIAVRDWPVPHRHPLLPVAVSAEEPRQYLVRIENTRGFSAPLEFVSESHLNRASQQASLLLGLYFGLTALAIVLALVSAATLRDNTYVLYAMTVFLMTATQACLTGIAGLHLWDGSPRWNDASQSVLPVLSAAVLVLFVSSVVSIPERSPPLHRNLVGLALVSLGVVAALLAQRTLRLPLVLGYLGATVIATLFTLGWAWRHGDRYARWLLPASLPVLFGAAFPIARAAELIPTSFWTAHSMQIGAVIEVPILLVILLLRSQERREYQRRLQRLDRVDPATGLINRDVFAERLDRMAARSRRLKHQSAVLIADLTNANEIQRRFDRRSAQELRLHVAGRLLSTAREIDTVARLDVERFGMLVEGPLTPAEAQAIGARMVARCLMPFKDRPDDWVGQLRVAQAIVPLDGDSAPALLARLEGLLDSVPPDSKRAVFPLGDRAPVAA